VSCNAGIGMYFFLSHRCMLAYQDRSSDLRKQRSERALVLNMGRAGLVSVRYDTGWTWLGADMSAMQFSRTVRQQIWGRDLDLKSGLRFDYVPEPLRSSNPDILSKFKYLFFTAVTRGYPPAETGGGGGGFIRQ
jgi:hypothetical protein